MHTISGFRARANGALRLLGAAAGRSLVGPRVVGLEITHFCNLKCGFCETHGFLMPAPIIHRRAYEGGRKSMDLPTIERLCGSLAKLGVAWVELSGKGDPIVHPKLPEIVRVIKQAGLQCSMFTNGTVPRPDLAATLVDAGLDRLNISLNAATRESYARVAGKDLWDKVIAFLDDVLALRSRAGGGRPWVRLSFVVNRDNVDDMERSVAFCREKGVNEGGWCVMGELPETTRLQLDHAQVETLLAGLPGWIASLEAAGVTHDLAGFTEDLKSRVGTPGEQNNPLQRSLPCYEGWMHTVISPDGAVTPCCYCEDEKFGNVFDQDFTDIWHGAKYADFRRRSLAMAETHEPICWECFTTCNRALQNRRIHERLGPLVTIRQLTGARRNGHAANGAPAA
ncbi:MAG: radical SAM protein [Candidatus Eisenbacteria bacterium]|nr:radical SAM protein [Candidatus Eisenbacteria bacterium]